MEQMQNPFEKISQELSDIKSLLAKLTNGKPTQTKEPVFIGIDQASEIVGLAKATVYKLIHTRKIPYYKTGKRVFFKSAELMTWIESGQRKTRAQIAAEV